MAGLDPNSRERGNPRGAEPAPSLDLDLGGFDQPAAGNRPAEGARLSSPGQARKLEPASGGDFLDLAGDVAGVPPVLGDAVSELGPPPDAYTPADMYGAPGAEGLELGGEYAVAPPPAVGEAPAEAADGLQLDDSASEGLYTRPPEAEAAGRPAPTRAARSPRSSASREGFDADDLGIDFARPTRRTTSTRGVLAGAALAGALVAATLAVVDPGPTQEQLLESAVIPGREDAPVSVAALTPTPAVGPAVVRPLGGSAARPTVPAADAGPVAAVRPEPVTTQFAAPSGAPRWVGFGWLPPQPQADRTAVAAFTAGSESSSAPADAAPPAPDAASPSTEVLAAEPSPHAPHSVVETGSAGELQSDDHPLGEMGQLLAELFGPVAGATPTGTEQPDPGASPETPTVADATAAARTDRESRTGELDILDQLVLPEDRTGIRFVDPRELDEIWLGEEIPMRGVDNRRNRLTPRVGAVRLTNDRGEVFEGQLYAIGGGEVSLSNHLGRMTFPASQVAKVERISEASAEVGYGATLPGERVRVRTAGGWIQGRLIENSRGRVTLITDSGGRITLASTEVVPVGVHTGSAFPAGRELPADAVPALPTSKRAKP
jgi:hypothetical protein